MTRKTLLTLGLAILAALIVWYVLSTRAEAPAGVGPAATSTPATSTSTPAAVPATPTKPAVAPKPADGSIPTAPGTAEIIGGPILSLSQSGLTIRGGKTGTVYVVTYASTTKIQKYNADGTVLIPMPASDLVLGETIRVVGTLQADGTVVARAVTRGDAAKQKP